MVRNLQPGRAGMTAPATRKVRTAGPKAAEAGPAKPLIEVGAPVPGPRNADTAADGIRYYTWRGQRYPSVTTIRRLAGIPHGLHQWALNQVINRVLDEAPSIAARLGSGEPSQVALVRQYLRTAATEERDKAAARGTAVHAAASEGLALTDVGPDIAPHLRQYIDWRTVSGVEVLASEFQIWNPTVGYAGSCDLLARFPDGSIWVVDLKTSKGTYGEHALQLIAYLMGEFVGADDTVDQRTTDLLHQASGMAVLHLTADHWEFHSVRPDAETWAAYRGLLAFGVWMAAHPAIGDVELGSRKGAA